ncbi:hypothetical protein BKA83DRAFT_4219885 [Pisolithus microcarpus]|nr:hypothetical protein BKA83DRAFT_4219885 [Pisolithus microcarpus]
MFPTAARLSKASRRPLTPKRGNKDFYKGTRQAVLPGGLRTGAPGRFIVRGSGKYRLLDEKVRVFVAPHISEINQCEVSSPQSSCCKMVSHADTAQTLRAHRNPRHFLAKKGPVLLDAARTRRTISTLA